MKKYVNQKLWRQKSMRRACIWRAAVRQIIRRDRKKLSVDLAERKQTRVRTPAKSALRAAGREIRRFRARSLRAKQILPDVSTADR